MIRIKDICFKKGYWNHTIGDPAYTLKLYEVKVLDNEGNTISGPSNVTIRTNDALSEEQLIKKIKKMP